MPRPFHFVPLLQEKEMEHIALSLIETLKTSGDESKISGTAEKVEQLCGQFPLNS